MALLFWIVFLCAYPLYLGVKGEIRYRRTLKHLKTLWPELELKEEE